MGLGLAAAQAPGRLIADTKIALVLDPGGFLGRATRLWQAEAGFGSIQNQAAGYLFPMGPFFLAGDAVGLPAWVVQRLWIGLLLGLAAWGTMRVAVSLGIGDNRSGLIAGAVYALSPTMLASIASTSGGQLPMALAPWALLPLVRGAQGGSPRRAAASSGLVIAAMGGINAASTLAVLPVGMLFLLTRARSQQRRSLMLWWMIAVPLAIAWWAGPLVVQGRYGFEFVSFTETAAVTTSTTSALEILRGAGYWLAHLRSAGRAWLPAGWMLVADPAVVLATGLLTAAGLAGLSRRDHPEKQFLVLTSVVLFTIMTAAYGGPLGAPLAQPTRDLLDGPLAPFRNLHKFEPGLRLCLALGLAHLVAVASLRRSLRPAAVVASVFALFVAATPAVTSSLPVDGSFVRVPAYWREAATWLGQHDSGDGERALLVPAAAFGEYRWGRPLDEPLEALAISPWAVRNLVPLGSAATRDLLDRIDREISTGQAVPGLAEVLVRSGVKHVVARNDLDLRRTGAPPPAVVRSALEATPGMRLVARFGPRVSPGLTADQLIPDLRRVEDPYRSIEVWEVQGVIDRVAVVSDRARVVGDATSTLSLTAADAQSGTSAPDDTVVVTDDRRDRARRFGDVRGGRSHALTDYEADPLSGGERVAQPGSSDAPSTSSVRYDGGVRLAASSSGAFGFLAPANQPFAAFDGSVESAWTPAAPRSAGAWIEISLPRPITVERFTLQLLRDRPTRAMAIGLRVSTDHVEREVQVEPIASSQTIKVDGPPTRRVRITFTRVRDFGAGTGGAGLAEISIPGVTVTRRVVLPDPAANAPVATLLRRETANRYLAGARDEDTTFDRSFQAPTGRYEITGTASLEPGADLSAVFPARPASIAASSRWNGLATFAPQQAFDNQAATAWLADPFDPSPTLHVAWSGQRNVGSVRVVPAPGPVRTPQRLTLLAEGGSRIVDLDRDGSATFPPLKTASLSIIITTSVEAPGAPAAFATPAATGASEIELPDISDLLAPAPAAPTIELPCGAGPVVEVGGERLETRVRGDRRAAVAHQPLTLTACSQVELQGRINLSAHDGGGFAIDTLAVRPAGSQGATPAPDRRLIVLQWRDEERRVKVSAGPAAVLALTESANPGWRAVSSGRVLTPVTVDGWRQGWKLPSTSASEVHMTFAPGRTYRQALIAGAGGLWVLLILAGWPRRRPLESLADGPGRPMSGPLALFVAVVAITLSGGVAVLLLPVLLLLRVQDRAGPVVAAGALTVAAFVAAASAGATPHSGTGTFGPLAQLLSLVAITAVAVSLVPATHLPRRPRP